MSFSTILSAVIEGLEVAFIHVEADISNGLPVFHMVGYLSSAKLQTLSSHFLQD